MLFESTGIEVTNCLTLSRMGCGGWGGNLPALTLNADINNCYSYCYVKSIPEHLLTLNFDKNK